nr:MAG TPA: hypothetical protein [Caudoviricetes sp.]
MLIVSMLISYFNAVVGVFLHYHEQHIIIY